MLLVSVPFQDARGGKLQVRLSPLAGKREDGLARFNVLQGGRARQLSQVGDEQRPPMTNQHLRFLIPCQAVTIPETVESLASFSQAIFVVLEQRVMHRQAS